MDEPKFEYLIYIIHDLSLCLLPQPTLFNLRSHSSCLLPPPTLFNPGTESLWSRYHNDITAILLLPTNPAFDTLSLHMQEKVLFGCAIIMMDDTVTYIKQPTQILMKKHNNVVTILRHTWLTIIHIYPIRIRKLPWIEALMKKSQVLPHNIEMALKLLQLCHFCTSHVEAIAKDMCEIESTPKPTDLYSYFTSYLQPSCEDTDTSNIFETYMKIFDIIIVMSDIISVQKLLSNHFLTMQSFSYKSFEMLYEVCAFVVQSINLSNIDYINHQSSNSFQLWIHYLIYIHTTFRIKCLNSCILTIYNTTQLTSLSAFMYSIQCQPNYKLICNHWTEQLCRYRTLMESINHRQPSTTPHPNLTHTDATFVKYILATAKNVGLYYFDFDLFCQENSHFFVETLIKDKPLQDFATILADLHISYNQDIYGQSHLILLCRQQLQLLHDSGLDIYEFASGHYSMYDIHSRVMYVFSTNKIPGFIISHVASPDMYYTNASNCCILNPFQIKHTDIVNFLIQHEILHEYTDNIFSYVNDHKLLLYNNLEAWFAKHASTTLSINSTLAILFNLMLKIANYFEPTMPPHSTFSFPYYLLCGLGKSEYRQIQQASDVASYAAIDAAIDVRKNVQKNKIPIDACMMMWVMCLIKITHMYNSSQQLYVHDSNNSMTLCAMLTEMDIDTKSGFVMINCDRYFDTLNMYSLLQTKYNPKSIDPRITYWHNQLKKGNVHIDIYPWLTIE